MKEFRDVYRRFNAIIKRCNKKFKIPMYRRGNRRIIFYSVHEMDQKFPSFPPYMYLSCNPPLPSFPSFVFYSSTPACVEQRCAAWVSADAQHDTFSCVSFRGKSTTTGKDDDDFGGLYTSTVSGTTEKPRRRTSRQEKEEEKSVEEV